MPDNSIEIDEQRKGAPGVNNEHIHVKGSKSAVTRKSVKKKNAGIPPCDMAYMPGLDRDQECDPTASLYPCAAPMKPIARHLQALLKASVSELQSGNSLAVPAKRQCKTQTTQETKDRQPWIPEGPLPCRASCLELLQEYSIATDKEEYKESWESEKLTEKDYNRLKKMGFWGDIQSTHKTSTGVLAVIVNRFHKKIAQDSAKVCKAIMVDASGAIKKGGCLFMPVKVLPKGTSGESGHAPSPIVVGWIVTISKVSSKGGMSSEVIQQGLRDIMKWVRVAYTDLCCDQDAAIMLAARELGMRIHLDKEHIERLIEEYSKRDCIDPKAPTDAERESIDKNKNLFKFWQSSQTPDQEADARKHVMSNISGEHALTYCMDHVFDKSPEMICQFGRGHLPGFYHSSNQIETLFDKFCNGEHCC